MKEDKNIDLEMILFFSVLALISFTFYIVKHPIFNLFLPGINKSALIYAYLFDLLLFLSVLIPYLLIVLYLLFFFVLRKIKIGDHIFFVLFFPLFAFFSKGMFLPKIYVDLNFFNILKYNFAFFVFTVMGGLAAFSEHLGKLISFGRYFIGKLR